MNDENISLDGIKIGYALCGSFCTFEKAFGAMRQLVSLGADVTPIMSYNAYSTDTRFGTAEYMRGTVREISGKDIICTIEAAEPVGPKKMFDLLVCAPCTGNTLSKLALNIIDTPVTLAIKSHLRNSRPVLIGLSTNDALSASAVNIGTLLNRKNYYFIPFSQDDSVGKPRSMILDFSLLPKAVRYAMEGKQLQPIVK